MQQILVVDDEVGIRELLSEILRDEGYQVALAENASEARSLRAQARPDLVLLDIWMPDTDGITLLKEWAANGQLTMPVVMMSGHGTIDTAVEATRLGAYDFLEKPIALQKLLSTVGRALKNGQTQPKPELALAALGRSAPIAELRQKLTRVANLKLPVLLTGEPGCGAEIAARFLHQAHTPWIAPAQTSGLVDAPLDLLAQAHDGILFLYDVSELSKLEQKGLLVATSRLDKYNARLVCGSTRPLADLVGQGAFDARLYGILSAAAIRVPALREHRDDVPELAGVLLARLIEAREVPLKRFSTAALNLLRNHDWPGNLTQLEAAVRSLALTAPADEIGPQDVAHVLDEPVSSNAGAQVNGLSLDRPLREARDAFERIYFEHHIIKEGGNMSRVAESVGLERTHLYRKLKQLGVRLARRPEEH